MRLGLGAGWLAIAAVASIACAGKLAMRGEGADGGEEADASPVGSSSGIGSTSSGGGVSSGSSGSSGGMPTGNDDAGPADDAGPNPTGVDCGAIPALHPNPAGDIYCGFDDAGPLTCTGSAGAGFCCLGGQLSPNMYAPDICAQNAAGCMIPSEGMAIPIQCNQISDCPSNGAPGATACCLQGASAPTPLPGCNYVKSKGGTAIVCEGSSGGAATACFAGEIQICSTDADCPSGTTCKPGKWKLFQIGFCM